jgi:hypothetical protein
LPANQEDQKHLLKAFLRRVMLLILSGDRELQLQELDAWQL